MFDLFVTILHVALFCGILAFALAVKMSRRRAESQAVRPPATEPAPLPVRGCGGCSNCAKSGCGNGGKHHHHDGDRKVEPEVTADAAPSIMSGKTGLSLVAGILAILGLALAFPDQKTAAAGASPEPPDYRGGELCWSKELSEGTLNFYRNPSRPLALIQVSYFLEFVPSNPDADLPELFKSAHSLEVRPHKGTEAALAVDPFRVEGYWWDASLIEWRINIPIAGSFDIHVVDSDGRGMALESTTLELNPYNYLNFGREFGIFVGGCVIVALLYFALTRFLAGKSATDEPSGQQLEKLASSSSTH